MASNKKKKTVQETNKKKFGIIVIIAALIMAGVIAYAVVDDLKTKAEETAAAQSAAEQEEKEQELLNSLMEGAQSALDEDEEQPENGLAVSAEDIMITHYAEIKIKDYGDITVALSGDVAPITVANFVKLASEGFYDGLTFHRIMEGFMMQGGDPLGNGTGGSDEAIKGEFNENGVENNISHVRGAISMARSQNPDSASSQFFIVHKDSTFLDGKYAGFGFVTEGMDVVDAVCADAQPVDGNGSIARSAQPVIESIRITEAE